ncbi:MAG: DegQ family serine endoprotease [Paracoccaceae bacterium]
MFRALWLTGLTLTLLLLMSLRAGAFDAPESFADLADQVSPSVVNITTSTVVEVPTMRGPTLPEGSPFEDFFRDFNDQFSNPDGMPGDNGSRSQRSQALGSGFVVSADGYIVTNNHVIEGADEIEIEFFSGDRLDAKLIGTDPKTDIALLKVESDEPLAFVSFGDSDVMRVGDWVMAMGNPLGQGFSVSAGIISARNRELSGAYDDFLQTDAAINRGNSGGPLFNLKGEVVGVNTAILSPNGGSIGIGFSMASNVVSNVVGQLREYGETRRGWLGVRIQDVTPDVAEAMGLSIASGALITDVPDGPAKDAGIQSGDIITTFDGRAVKDGRELVRRVADAAVGAAIKVGVLRDGEELELTVTLGQREKAEGEPVPVKAQSDEPVIKDLLGMKLSALTEEMRGQMNLPESTRGLVITDIDQASEAFGKGLRSGDLLVEAGQKPVASLADLEAQITDTKEAGRKSLLLLIRRDGDPRFVALSVE